MAVVPFTPVPNVAPDARPPSDYQTEQASPAAFGSIGAQELEQTGRNLQEAGAAGIQATVALQTRYNEIAVQDAYNKLQKSYIDLTYYHNPDDPSKPGIYGMKGRDAMDAAQPTLNALESSRQGILDGLTNPAQKLAFESASRRLQYFTQADIGRHVDQQATVWGADTAKSQGDLARQNAGLYYNDPDKLNAQAMAARNAAISGVKVALGQGLDPSDPNIQDAMNKADSGVVINAVLGRAANDPVGARNMLNTWTLPGHLPGDKPISFSDAVGEVRPQLLEQINNRADQVEGGLAGTAAFNRTVGSGGNSANAGPIADKTLPPEAQKFLPALSGGEGNYNSPAPKGDKSTTPLPNNRYQFLYSTWLTEAPKAGVAISDHSPEAQDKVAWQLAQDTYKNATGGNLQADIAAGGHEQAIALALNKIWPSLPGGSEQNTTMQTWLSRLGNGPIPTTNNARPPLTGDQILAGEAAIDNDPRATTPQWRAAAHADFQHHLATYQLAQQTDAKNALNELGPKIALDPTSVKPQDIWNRGDLTYAEKMELSRQLTQEQSGQKEGDGAQFMTVFQRTNLPVGDPQRINSDKDLIPYMGNGLTFQGLNKMRGWLKDRDTPDAAVQKAALDGWRMQIEGTAGGLVSPGPVSRDKWTQFLGWALPEIEKEKGSKTMAQIVSPTGDIAKAIPHYFLTPDEISQNLLGQVATGDQPGAPPGTPPSPSGPPRPVQGQWYKGTQQVPPGTPGARYYNGGALSDPASWLTAPPGPHPSAPAGP